MNALEEIREVFERELSLKDIHFIGRTCMGRNEGNLRGKIEMGGMGIRISVLERTSGLVDEMKFLISDVTGRMLNDNRDYVWPKLDIEGDSSWWNCRMEEQDYLKITDALNGYLDLFQSEVQIQEAEQDLGMSGNIIY